MSDDGGRRQGRRRGTGRARPVLVGAVLLVAMIVLSSCYVNQRDLWAIDKLSPDAPVSMTPTRSMVPYGPYPDQHLNVYMPDRDPVGVIMWLHSGGWCCGDQINVDPLVLDMIGQGYAVVGIDYRRAPEFHVEALASDIDRAIRFVKSKRVEWGIEHGKLILGGGSAGGHLALLGTTASNVFVADDLPDELRAIDPKVDATIAFVGPSDLRPYVNHEITTEGINGPGLVENLLSCSNAGAINHATGLPFEPCPEQRVLYASPLFWTVLNVWLGTKLPPVYLAYSEADGLVPPSSQAEPLAYAWQQSAGFLETWLDLPVDSGHNISWGVNRSAFLLWLQTFG